MKTSLRLPFNHLDEELFSDYLLENNSFCVRKMLNSCNYCGRIHDKKIMCAQKKQAMEKRWSTRKKTDASKFRKTNAWTNTSLRIRDRDKYMCLCCKEGLKGTLNRYNTKDLSVHHIIPIEEDYTKRMDGDNLITVCCVHHEMCEAGIITRETQRELALKSMHDAGEDADAPLVY